MKRFFFDCGTRDMLASAGLLVLRAAIGLMMLIGHGLPKFGKFEDLKDGWLVPAIWPLSSMSPPVSLVATLLAEIGAAGLLVLGLATRPASFLLGFAMIVAAFQYHGADPFFGPGPAKEMAVLYLAACVTVIISGAGRWSLDAAIYKEKKRRFF